MRAHGVPTVQEILHHAWTRTPFTHLPSDPAAKEHLEQAYLRPGTCADLLAARPGGIETALLVARAPGSGNARSNLVLWEGRNRIRPETFQGWFGRRFPRVSASSFRTLLQRVTHFFIASASEDPVYVFPLPQFARLGASHNVLERVLDASVLVASEGQYAARGCVPSLRVFSSYDGNRYGHSTRKLFYNRHGHAVNVELMAREILGRLGYETVPPVVLSRLFAATVGRSPADFRPDVWPRHSLASRVSPFLTLLRAERRLQDLQDHDVHEGLVGALAAWAKRPWFGQEHQPADSLPLIGRYVPRSRLPGFLETVGEDRLLVLFRAFARGHRMVSADWFAYRAGSRRAFPCEVKSRGDHLRPTQKESILDCQRTGLFDYRLLELHHTAAEPSTPVPALAPRTVEATRHG